MQVTVTLGKVVDKHGVVVEGVEHGKHAAPFALPSLKRNVDPGRR